MNNDNKLIPQYRFPEFKDDGRWDVDVVNNLIKTTTPPKKLNSNEYLKEGRYPIVDQSKNFYCGYSNDKEALISPENDLIVFGDHTCITKYINHPFIQGADGIKIFSTRKSVLPNYFYQFLQYSPVKQEEYKRHFSILKDKIISYPTNPAEQQKIAACLSGLDDVIVGHEEKLTALEEHKKGLMQNFFPQKGETQPRYRFPEFLKEGDWDVSELENISLNIMVGIASAATHAYRCSGIVLFRNQNIKRGYLDDSDILFIEEEYEKSHRNKRLKAGDLLTARTGYPGTTCVVPEKYEGSQSFTTLITRPDKKIINSYFLSYYINSDIGQEFFETKKIGGGQKNVNATTLAKMPILYPNLKEQQKITSVLSSVDELIVAQQEKIEALKEHKKGLMQGLFPKIES
ncbi:restriction endonuclease subunit S [Myroides odoratimimus]|uniref:restriction endonuclease subunit S n=1 Tax=Myroides odoratimimus TaxID=76832 RepID=UPI002DBB9875|nr:restriction endonuclease subunit S [Myroides odoratimimus]MEC4036816.1 restriction endonuclease subunit S [Myroides odoratimimus]